MNRKLYSTIVLICMMLVSCALVSNVRVQSDINADKKLLVEYRSKLLKLRMEVIRNDTITMEQIVSFYDPTIKGMVTEYNLLAEEGKVLTAKDTERYAVWRIQVIKLGEDIAKLRRIYEANIHGASPLIRKEVIYAYTNNGSFGSY